jgi:Kinetochore protein Mis14 like
MEPFDEALDRETWSLYNQRLQWDLELATKRRKRPQEIMDNLENLFKVQDEELDKPMEEQDEDRSLPDGQLVTQFTGLATELNIYLQKLCSQTRRRTIRTPRWPLYLRAYAR